MMDGEDSSGKRQREPLSDTEDNVPLSSVKDGKRRRLEVLGQENCSPQPSSSSSSAWGRCRELEVKADTPAPLSVRSRVQQLTQRREGLPPLAQRCLSDPGYQVPSVLLLQDKVSRDHLIGEEEFSQRVERFNAAPGLPPSPLPGPANPGPLNRSSLVTDIHHKLQGSVTPSSKQASRIRQEREAELRLLRAQPISDNVWLKRSCSDSSLAERGTSPTSASSPSWAVRRTRRLQCQWPPLQPWDADCETSPVTNSSFSDKPVPTGPPGGEDDSQLDHTGEETQSSSLTDRELLLETDTSLSSHQGAAETQGSMDVSCQGEPPQTERPETEERPEMEAAVVEEAEQVEPPTGEPEEQQMEMESVFDEDHRESETEGPGEEKEEVVGREEEEEGGCAPGKQRREEALAEDGAEQKLGSPARDESCEAEGSLDEDQAEEEPSHAQEQEEAHGLSDVRDERSASAGGGRGSGAEEPPMAGVQCEGSNGAGVQCEGSNGAGVQCEGSDGAGVQCEGSNGAGVQCEGSNGAGVQCERSNGAGVQCEGSNGAGVQCEGSNGADRLSEVDASLDGEPEMTSAPLDQGGLESCREEEEARVLHRMEEEESGDHCSKEEQEMPEEHTGQSPREEEETEESPSREEEETGESPSREEEEETGESPSREEEEETGESPSREEEEEAGESPSREEEEEETGESPSREEEETGESPSREEEETGNPCSMEMQEEEELTGEVDKEEEEEQMVQSESRGVKKVTFILEPELITDDSALQSELDSSSESRRESVSELSSHDELNTTDLIDQMFDEVLEMATAGGRGLEEGEDHDSGIAAGAGEKEKTDVECDKEEEETKKKEEEEEEEEEIGVVDTSGDELTFPLGILSPLSKSVEAVVTPLRLAASQQARPAFQPLTPQELTTPPPDATPLYSVDAYRTQRQSAQPAFQSVTPGVQRRAPEKPRPQTTVNTKERIMALNEEAGKLQTVIGQTLQALGCCTDEEHGRGSQEEAEAEKLLLVSSEKRASLLAEVSRLREKGPEEPEAGGSNVDSVTQKPCRGTVSISSVQLPLKVEFVCSARNRTGRPSHYFFVLIRYGPCDLVTTQLATAADALNGDTISFPISITLQDIRSSFEIDVEVYSLSHTSGTTCHTERSATKSRVTPRKLLNTITQRSNHTTTSSALPALSTRRSSNFSLVGSHKITLASLGQSKFPLDKMKFEGKIRRLLGDEFQEKVPFLSPLEGSVYLRLDSEGHSSVQHHGFLTMFEVIKGFGAWHRRFLVLEGGQLSYWNHPNDQGNKPAEGSISLSSSSSQSVKPVKRDSCARPFTFELVSNVQTQQEGDPSAPSKCWFSADTREERADWMDKLNQVLLDVHTWSHRSVRAQQPSSGPQNLRESSL